MVTATRSGWTAANGHVPKPDLDALSSAHQEAFYRTQLEEPVTYIPLKDFVKPQKLTMYSNAGNVSKRRAERAFFAVNNIETEIFCNWGDAPLIDARTNPAAPVPDGWASKLDFVQSFASNKVEKIRPFQCQTWAARPALERWAKLCGELQKPLDKPTLQWLKGLGPIIRNFAFSSKPPCPLYRFVLD